MNAAMVFNVQKLLETVVTKEIGDAFVEMIAESPRLKAHVDEMKSMPSDLLILLDLKNLDKLAEQMPKEYNAETVRGVLMNNPALVSLWYFLQCELKSRMN